MILYHVSDTLQLGETLNGDFMNLEPLIYPFFRALKRSEDCFFAMLMHAHYMSHVLYRNNIPDWTNCSKYATEAIFEYVRESRFPDCKSRIWSSYFSDDLDACRHFYDYVWRNTKDEVKARVHMYEIEIDQSTLEKRDMRLYDIAYDGMCADCDIDLAMDCAKRYFAGESSENPIWEYMSDAPAVAARDVTHLLKKD